MTATSALVRPVSGVTAPRVLCSGAVLSRHVPAVLQICSRADIHPSWWVCIQKLERGGRGDWETVRKVLC